MNINTNDKCLILLFVIGVFTNMILCSNNYGQTTCKYSPSPFATKKWTNILVNSVVYDVSNL